MEGFFSRFHASFESGFDRLREAYVGLLKMLLSRRAIVPMAAALVLALGAVMFMFVGRDFYPAIASRWAARTKKFARRGDGAGSARSCVGR